MSHLLRAPPANEARYPPPWNDGSLLYQGEIAMRAELVERVRTGELHPRELVAEALRRIEAHDPPLNAVVALRAQEALADAERVDPSGPLAGLPVLVKDLIEATNAGLLDGSITTGYGE